MTPVFLAVVGVAYVLLAAWCVILPRGTSDAIGYELRPGDGQSEYLVMYGAVQGAVGLFFLLPLLRPGYAMPALELCLLTHGMVVLVRTIGFVLYSGFSRVIPALAVSEWVIFLASLVVWWNVA